ncbi:MAG TPA: hypothetical protein VKG44_04015 [Candidatus Baltobacteraceae bacterium]|nr:hypothetical protein [Candidatus Baltobacteraceae bacterium]
MPNWRPHESLGLAVAALLLVAASRPAGAIPYFANEYGVTCQKCHSIIPRLNAFGQAFLDHGYSLPGAVAGRPFPLSAKLNLLFTSDPAAGFPKTTVDELELFLAGKPSARTNYFVEQYVVDGGAPGSLREAWFANRFTPDAAKVPIYAQGGIFTLPLPVDPEAFRETYEDYAIDVQTVGDNPFNLKGPKVGVQGRIGSADRGLSSHFLALQGHDQQSGLPTLGIDLMNETQQVFGPIALTYYGYVGKRPDITLVDNFWRQGLGLTYASTRWAADLVWQLGNDSTFLGTPGAVKSGGGFAQLRYQMNLRTFALVRYDAANGPPGSAMHDFVPLLGFRVSHNSRFTVEEVFQNPPQPSTTLNLQYTVGM